MADVYGRDGGQSWPPGATALAAIVRFRGKLAVFVLDIVTACGLMEIIRGEGNLDDVRIYTGTLVADLILEGARSLKDRRAPLRSLVQRLRNRHLAVAQVGPPDLRQRVFLAVTAVAGAEGRTHELLDSAERVLVASEFTIGDLRRDIHVESFASER